MKTDILQNYCLSKLGTKEDYPFGPQPTVLKVGSKIFALILKNEKNSSISLKCDPFLAEQLRAQYSSVSGGYHLNKQHWNTVKLDGSIPEKEIYWMIDHSYELILKSLTKMERSQIQ